MTETTVTDANPGASTTNGGVEAELFWTASNRPPEVTLAFDGLHEPRGLFADLHTMGWNVPPVPPRPGSAIEWVPDPTTGADFTIRNWRVKEFRLTQGSWWTAEQASTIGATTIEALRRHGVKIAGLRGEHTEAVAAAPGPVGQAPVGAPATSPPATPAETPSTAPPGATTGPARVIVLDPTQAEIAGCQMFNGSSGRKRIPCMWGESAHEAATLFPQAANFEELTERGGQAWTVSTAVPRPVAASAATAVVQMVVPDASESDSTVKKLAKLMGKDAVLIPLEPIHSGNQAVLFCATVPTNSLEMLTSNLRLRCPQGIIRSDV